MLDYLRDASYVEGWAVLKGWKSLPYLRGDLDLIVSRESQAPLMERTRTFLLATGSDRDSFLVHCDHIPGVPRLFAYLPAKGFGDHLLEVDFATLLPLRGFRAVSYRKLQPFIVFDDLGYPRTNQEVDELLHFLTRSVGWLSVQSDHDFGQAHAMVARSVFGRSLGAAIMRMGAGRRLPAIGLSFGLLLRSLIEPGFALERLKYRLRDRRSCLFDPAQGRAIRLVESPHNLQVTARLTGHSISYPP